MRPSFISLLICSAVLAWTTNASAQRACESEVREFCEGVSPGAGRVAKCLYEHNDDLSKACKRQTDKLLVHTLEVHVDCIDDAERFCDGVEPGEGRVGQCLNEHRDSLSRACRGHVNRGRRVVMGLQACQKDAERLCSDVEPGEDRVMSCLWDQRDELSKKCRKLIKRHQTSG